MPDGREAAYPESYQPSPPKGGAAVKIGWLFSAVGRGRLRLGKACRLPEDARCRSSLAAAVPGLLSRAERGDQRARDVAAQAMMFLTWACTRAGEYDDAGQMACVASGTLPRPTGTCLAALGADDPAARGRGAGPICRAGRGVCRRPDGDAREVRNPRA